MKRKDKKQDSLWGKIGRFFISDIPLKLLALGLAVLTFIMVSM